MSTLPLPNELVQRRDVVEGESSISLGRRVEIHDDFHVEIKLDYGLPLKGKTVDYQVQIWFFFPGSLDVNGFTLPRRVFYQDIHAYLRFKTPELSYDELSSRTAEVSPLAKLIGFHRRIVEGHQAADELRNEIVEEIKLFGCLTRVFFRDKLARTETFIELAEDEEDRDFYDRERLLDGTLRFDGQARTLLRSYREVRALYQAKAGELPEAVGTAFADVDEYLSFQYEKYFCALLEEIKRTEDGILCRRLEATVLEGLRAERNYRKAQGFDPGPVEGSDNEWLVHRMRTLKKFVGSALYLEMRRVVPEDAYSDWIGALAAGLAMLVSTLMLYWFGPTGTRAFDLTALMAIVLIYVFKDRIKDGVKRQMAQQGLGWFPDLDTKIVDVDEGLTLGRCQETTRWIEPDKVPPIIEHCRDLRSNIHAELRRATGETILRYDKVVTLHPEEIKERHRRRGDVNDIIRFRLERFTRHMDLPAMQMLTLDPVGDRVVAVKGHKSYFVNLVIRYAVEGKEPTYEKVRLVLDKHGLRRVDVVVPPLSEKELEQMDSDEELEEWVRSTYAG